MREFISDVGDAIGTVVYVAAYAPIFLGWHLVGRHVVRAGRHVLENSHQHEVDLLIEAHGDTEVLKELLVRAYYNALRREAQEDLRRAA